VIKIGLLPGNINLIFGYTYDIQVNGASNHNASRQNEDRGKGIKSERETPPDLGGKNFDKDV